MKIIYMSDGYTYNNYGTKRSIFLEMQERKDFEMIWISRTQILNIVKIVKEHKPDQLWLAHSGLIIPDFDIRDELKKMKVVVVGWGMSDPNYFNIGRVSMYDAYITNSICTYYECMSKLPCFYHKTACDFKFHNFDKSISKDIHMTMIGLARHPYFPNKDERKDVVNELRERGYKVEAYGKGWPEHPNNHGHIEGEKFRELLQRSKLGLDIQNLNAPLAHRMFEYSGCGIPVITRRRQEVLDCFKDGLEIITYDALDELYSKVGYYKMRPAQLATIGEKAYERCTKEHNISHRIDKLIPFVKSLSSSV